MPCFIAIAIAMAPMCSGVLATKLTDHECYRKARVQTFMYCWNKNLTGTIPPSIGKRTQLT